MAHIQCNLNLKARRQEAKHLALPSLSTWRDGSNYYFEVWRRDTSYAVWEGSACCASGAKSQYIGMLLWKKTDTGLY